MRADIGGILVQALEEVCADQSADINPTTQESHQFKFN